MQNQLPVRATPSKEANPHAADSAAAFHDGVTPPPGMRNIWEGMAMECTAHLRAFLAELDGVLTRHPDISLSYAAACGPAGCATIHTAPVLLAPLTALSSTIDPAAVRATPEGRHHLNRLHSTCLLQLNSVGENFEDLLARLRTFPPVKHTTMDAGKAAAAAN